MQPFLSATELRAGQSPDSLPDWALGIRLFAPNQSYSCSQAQQPISNRCLAHQIPHGAFGYLIPKNSEMHSIIDDFNLSRLDGIRQLDYKTPPFTNGYEGPLKKPFQHTRFQHSLDVATIMSLLLTRIDLDEDEKRHGVIGALLHDLLTPAGGDSTKLLDHIVFDEDENFEAHLQNKRISRICAKHGIDPKRLNRIILERCIVGQLKDIADKIAYIARDSMNLLHAHSNGGHPIVQQTSTLVKTIYTCQPRLADLWEDVRIEDGSLSFTDPDRLSAFLLLRAIMFRDLYQHPSTRGVEFILHVTLSRRLFEIGILPSKTILQSTDKELTTILESTFQVSLDQLCDELRSSPQHQVFSTRQDADSFIAELQKKTPFIVFEPFGRAIKSGTHWKIQDGDKRLPLHMVSAQQAREIDSVAREASRIMVHWIEDIPMELKQAFELIANKKPA